MTSFSRKSKPPSSLSGPGCLWTQHAGELLVYCQRRESGSPRAWTRFRGKAERIDGRIPKHVDYDDGRKKVFRYEGDQLQLHLNPVLPAWLFDENQEVSFIFLGAVKVTYRDERAPIRMVRTALRFSV